ncbi:E3 ubiquitin-protein ligase hel2 [Acrodontium crateriforme]|uniref:RING-type E3 ubiquitin transferase n=1 Tax=Acrodontium crateriforme TaxID=150365 RepID=A0AAQ3M708_9PEZI|nr:E3 ubiquitin-protein ligase hel2 [Acrodontium crateriforme]
MADPTNPSGTTDQSTHTGGRGRGGRGDTGNDDTRNERTRGGVRGRGRGRGRGGRGNAGRAAVAEQKPTNAHSSPQPSSARVFSQGLSKDTGNTIDETSTASIAEDDVEAEVCFICASPISHQSVAPCNHRTCHICSLRLRALYKTKACAHCRTEADTVIFTDEGEKRYEDYVPPDFFKTDRNLGISYEKPEIFEDTVLLLRYNCPDEECDVACMGWPDLHRHVRSVHNKVMCDLCTRHKKVFTHEHELFTHQDLKRHEKFGDDNPGAIDQSGFKGHPECGFCRQRFYGDDELYVHCREKHERCHLCDRRNGGNNPQYYVNYDSLEHHFTKDHFPCMDSECQEKKFVVFDSEMDLKAHQLEQHPNGLSKDARRDARRVDISSFDFRSQYEEPRRGGRGGRRGGRGRDPNAEAMPASAAAHLSRAEIAHQRAREIQSAQSVSNRTFGGALTQPEPQAQPVTRPLQAPVQTPAPPQFPPLNSRPAVNTDTSAALTPQEQARQLRHAAVTERASTLLRNDQTKLSEFRARISTYRSGTMTASDLINAFFSLFDASSAELGTLIKELADIFEIPTKRDNLLKAWADWKAINEDYPSLSGPTGASTASAAGIGGSRVLKLKSSTAQSSRSVAGRAASPWTRSTTATMSSTPFPSLPPRSAGPKAGGTAGAAPTANWLAIRPANSSASSSAKPSPVPSRTQSSINLPRGDAFPALPAAAKPTSTVFSPGYRGAGVIRRNDTPTLNAWGGGSGSGTPAVEEPEPDTFRKGKKGKKVVLQWG